MGGPSTELEQVEKKSDKGSSDGPVWSKPRTCCEDPKKPAADAKKDSPEMIKVKKRVACTTILALICLAIGITLVVLWPGMFDKVLKQELILSSKSMSFKMWKETPVPMYLKIYLFNWTNYEKFDQPTSEKPHFDEMGPYVFKEIDYKVNETWNDNGTVTFSQKRVWFFEPSMSKGTLDDKITMLNPVIASVGYLLRNKIKAEKDFIYLLLVRIFGEKMQVTVPVRSILFDGYDDKLLEIAKKLGIKNIPFDRFAFFYQRNNSDTYDGIFNMQTGKDNFNTLGILNEWKYKKTSPFYPGKCGNLQSSLGDLWPPLPNNDSVSVFSPDVCTTLTLKNMGTTNWLGLTGIKFGSDADMLDDGSKVPSRKCYCEGVECLPSGALNVSTCKFGAPAFVSLPHFYLADESYRNNISGMKPDKEKHEFSLVVQPVTGSPMQVRAALQLNFLVQPDNFRYFKNLPPMLVPMLWFTQEVNLTSEYSNQIKILLLAPPIGTVFFSIIAGIGVMLIALSAFMYLRQRKRDEMNERLVPKDIPNTDSESGVENEE